VVVPAAFVAALVCCTGDATAGKGDEKTTEARNRAASQNNLKQLMLGTIEYADANKTRLPPPAVLDAKGKPLLSWRVLILPYLGEKALYEKFKLDEPWDSPHNKELLKEMPKVFAPPGIKTKEPYTTFYKAIVGPGAAWEINYQPGVPFNARLLRYPAEFRDGTSNTIGLVEGVKAVPWTKPEDVTYDPKGALPKLGGQFKDGSYAAFMDGSVRLLSRRLSEATLRAIITRTAGDLPGNDLD
jgi:hypothetical protein